jgi:hypothetical protein
VRSFAIFRKLFGGKLQIKDFAKQLPRLFISKQKVAAIDH